MFALKSRIKIGDFSFSGVHEVIVEKSMFSLNDSAQIKIPGKARLKNIKTNNITDVQTFSMFKSGDPVTISLGYNNTITEEFKGFIESYSVGEILTIECIGYVHQLRNKAISKFWKQISLRELLTEITQGTDVTFILEADMKLVNLSVINGTAAKLLGDIIARVSNGFMTAFFIEPTVLWVGLRYTGDRNTIKYKLGYNSIKDELTQEHVEPTSVLLVYKKTNGKRIRAKSKSIGSNQMKLRTSHIEDENTITDLAKWAAQKENNDIFRGKINCFLEPFAQPGDKAVVFSERYKHKEGIYIIESTKVTYGAKGARRTIEIGQKVGVIDADVNVEILDK